MFASSKPVWLPAALAVAATILYGCGGGGGGDGAPPGRAIDRSGQSAGTITGFGSIFVNGVEWNTDTATITVDHQPAEEGDLMVGENVIVAGSLDDTGLTGNADTVQRDTLLKGTITSVDATTSTMLVLGQIVLIDADTRFAAPLIDLVDLGAGGVAVEIDGLFTADGNIVATLVQLDPAGTSNRLHGVVSNYNSSANRFALGALNIDVTTAAFEDFPDPLAAGDFVEVEGSLFDVSGALIAERVKLEARSAVIGLGEGTHFEIEGLITAFTNSTDFAVSAVAVTTDQGTRYENGSELDLALNARIEVEGRVGANTTVVADEIEFKIESDLVIEAIVEAVADSGDEFTMLGIDIAATPTTQFLDESDVSLASIGITDLAVGDYVKVKAVSGTTPVRARLIKRLNPEDQLKLTGSVSSVNDPEFGIEGALVRTDGATSFEDATGTPITAAEFFAAVQSGSRVGVEGQSPFPGILQAASVELK